MMTLPDDVSQLSFEAAFLELERIIARLENEENTLEESMEFYARGQALAKHCSLLLEQAELKVRTIGGDTLSDFSGE